MGGVAELDVAEVVDESLEQLAEPASVCGRPAIERVAQVRLEHTGDALPRVAPGSG